MELGRRPARLPPQLLPRCAPQVSPAEPDAIGPPKRKALLATFSLRYGVYIEPDEQPSDKLLASALMGKLRKVADFISLKDARSALAERLTETEQVTPGTRLMLVATDQSARKQTDFHFPSLYFLRGLRSSPARTRSLWAEMRRERIGRPYCTTLQPSRATERSSAPFGSRASSAATPDMLC